MRWVRRLFHRLFRRTCREMSRLISESQERRLSAGERFVLRIHLGVCDACVRYRRQVRFLGRAMGRWRHYSDH